MDGYLQRNTIFEFDYFISFVFFFFLIFFFFFFLICSLEYVQLDIW